MAIYDTTVDESATAGWTLRSGFGGVNGDFRYRAGGGLSTDVTQWAISGLTAGKEYQVFVAWVPEADLGIASPEYASDAPYEVWDGGNQEGSVIRLDQRYAPADGAWQRLGIYTADTTGFTIKLRADADGYLVADAVRVVEVGSASRTEYSERSEVTKTIDAFDRETTYEYDNWGRTIIVTMPDPDGGSSQIAAQTRFEYDLNGNLRYEKQRTDDSPLTFLSTEHQYDHLDRKIKTIDANGDPTTYQYDKVGNLTKLTDAENNDTSYSYYNDDRLKIDSNDLGQQQVFQYDGNGNLTKYRDRNARFFDYIFDNLGRQTEERWKSGVNVIRTISFEYDLAGRVIEANDDGTGARDYVYEHDQLGRLERTSWEADGDDYELINTYDDLSRRTGREMKVNTASVLTDAFVFDRLSRATSVRQEGDASVLDKRADFNYNAAGQLDWIKRYDDLTATTLIVTSTYGYDDAGRLDSLEHRDDSNVLLSGYEYDWDAVNRIIEMDFVPAAYNSEDATFSYDSAGQLTGADRTTDDESYTYDDNGNRETANGATYTTNSNNRLFRDGVYEYTYDNEGNRTKRITLVGGSPTGATTEYAWDYRNRLTEVVERPSPSGTPTKRVTLGYDAQNRWTRTEIDPDGDTGSDAHTWTENTFDGMDLIHTVQSNGDVAYYSFGPGVDLVLFQQTEANDTEALLGDHLNTVRDVVNTSGVVENHIVFDTFGNASTQSDPTHSTIIGFTGRVFEDSIGLQYNYRRWYDAGVGRWMSEDPIGFAAGDANLNRYVGNMPTTQNDPDGLVPGGPYPPRTEQYDKKQLLNIVKKWSENGWGLAATLLSTFLGRKGAKTVDLVDVSQYADDVRHSQIYLKAASAYFSKLAGAYAKPGKKVIVNLRDKPAVTGDPTAGYKVDNAAFSVTFAGGLDNLFYAFLGARVGYTNATLTINCAKGSDSVYGWEFNGKMRVVDTYTFAPRDFPRMLFEEYRAAHRLEFNHGYKPFIAIMEWDETLSGVVTTWKLPAGPSH